MTNLNNHSTSNTSEEPELSMEELDAKWDALENDLTKARFADDCFRLVEIQGLRDEVDLREPL